MKADLSKFPELAPSLFDNTSRNAGVVAAKSIPNRYRAICELLIDGPLAIFQIAAKMDKFDHQISGRFSELQKDGLIELANRRVVKPDTECQAEQYQLTAQGRTWIEFENKLAAKAAGTEATENTEVNAGANFWKAGL